MSRASFRYTTNRTAPERDDDWRDGAACRDQDPELFFSVGSGPSAQFQDDQAKAVCGRCDVSKECLLWALAGGVDDGVWGGKTAAERRALKGDPRIQAAIKAYTA